MYIFEVLLVIILHTLMDQKRLGAIDVVLNFTTIDSDTRGQKSAKSEMYFCCHLCGCRSYRSIWFL